MSNSGKDEGFRRGQRSYVTPVRGGSRDLSAFTRRGMRIIAENPRDPDRAA
jgi:hypothetical protein